MKVFLDECIDWRLSREIAGHDVRTARDVDWTGVKNGELLRRVAASFDVFITVDSNLSFQQNLKVLPVAVVVLRARRNRLADLRPLLPDLLAALEGLPARAVTIIG